jgi:serine/threonine protein phosphatase 1
VFGRKTKLEPLTTSASVPDGVRVYAIGDIHGRSDLVDRQHAMIDADFTANPAPVVHLIYLGDYVDRGPDSFGVLDRLAAGAGDFVNVTMLRGNHEEMLLRFLDEPAIGLTWRQLGGMETLLSYGVDVGEVLADKGYPGLSRCLHEKLPLRHRLLLQQMKPYIAVGDYFFCHAGVRPGVPLELQQERDLLWIRDPFLHAKDDFGKIVVHGHSPTEQPDIRTNRINIDTGAYATGRLSCLVLDGSSRRFLST